MATDDRSSEREMVTVEQARPAPVLGASFRVEVVDGPSRGAVYAIEPDAGPTFLGQALTCTIQLNDPSVSRRHLRLEPRDGVLQLTDLDSTNGTLVNDVAALEARLRGGELLQVGSSVLRVSRGPDRPRAATRRTRFGRLIGASEAMQPVYRSLERSVDTRACTLIEGESGTGKELVAELIHESGPRARGELIVVRASALVDPPTDPRGAEPDVGLFDAALGGTLVLQEITELSVTGQRQLRERVERQRQSSRAAVAQAGHADVRLLATSSVSLDHAVEQRRFDSTLADLLTEERIELPALCQRRGDVELLAAHFWAAFGGPAGALTAADSERLASRRWPGNVGELQLEVARLVARKAGPVDPPPTRLEDFTDLSLPYTRARQRLLDRFERLYVQRMLERANGNVSKAAEAAGIARRYFQIVKSRHHL